MKIFKLNPFKILLLAVSCLICSRLQATTYTAIASGWYTTGTIWQGSLVPSININADTVIIPAGITVKLNQDLTLTGPGLLRVNGTLSSDTAETDAILNSGSLEGTGTIDVDSIELDMMTGFDFAGTTKARKFATRGTIVNSGATFDIAEAIYARAGSFLIPAGSMNIANDVWVIFMGGMIDFSSFSNINTLGRFNARYHSRTGNLSTGTELSETSLKDIEVFVPTGASVVLNSDMTARGSFKIRAGILDLNGYSLTIGTDGYVAADNRGYISANPPSSIIVNGTNSSLNTINFTAAGNTVKNLVINMTNSFSSFSVGAELNVDDTLFLQMGRLLMNNNELIMAPGSVVSGGSSSSYVVPGQSGSLRMTLTNGIPATYMVGTTNDFAPAMIMPNNVPSTGSVGVTVHPAVYVNSTNGEQIGVNQPLVNATWYVKGPAGSNINIDLEPMWSSNMEVNGFDKQKAYVGMYIQGRWDTTNATAVTAQSTGLYSLRRNNIKGYGTFAIFDQRAKTTDAEVLVYSKQISVFPNPATSDVMISIENADLFREAQMFITNTAGIVIKRVTINSAQMVLPRNNTPAGLYFYNIYNSNGIIAQGKLHYY
ncbi:MAG: T9SS type A sorting domain-containing protein [Sphingobacteriales bacterium]|nr:MAG: T9SS type A sorting domain-containing protein [Sphingobacteriales bacterium]